MFREDDNGGKMIMAGKRLWGKNNFGGEMILAKI